MLEKIAEGEAMGVHQWARQELEGSLQRARAQGFDPVMTLRALLSEAVELNRLEREVADLAQELQFLADNLDPQRDYAFMRP
jgi:flagellar biosynthesis/type III secretory pathway protein FliH